MDLGKTLSQKPRASTKKNQKPLYYWSEDSRRPPPKNRLLMFAFAYYFYTAAQHDQLRTLGQGLAEDGHTKVTVLGSSLGCV